MHRVCSCWVREVFSFLSTSSYLRTVVPLPAGAILWVDVFGALIGLLLMLPACYRTSSQQCSALTTARRCPLNRHRARRAHRVFRARS